MAVNRFINLSNSGQVAAGACILEGMYVNSTSSGTVKLYHGTSGADTGTPMNGTITPAIGYHYLGSLDATAGVYASLSNTINVTFHIRQEDR